MYNSMNGDTGSSAKSTTLTSREEVIALMKDDTNQIKEDVRFNSYTLMPAGIDISYALFTDLYRDGTIIHAPSSGRYTYWYKLAADKHDQRVNSWLIGGKE